MHCGSIILPLRIQMPQIATWAFLTNHRQRTALKTSCAKETINKTKRQPSEWERIFASEATDKGLISKIYKRSCSSISKKQTLESKNGQKTLIDISPKKIYRLPTNK